MTASLPDLLHGPCPEENRNGLVVSGGASLGTGTVKREAALALVDVRRGKHRITLGADKARYVAYFVASLGSCPVSLHIAIDGHPSKTGKPRKTSVDRRVTRHIGNGISQRCRKRIEVRLEGQCAGSGLLPGSRCYPGP